MVFSSKAKMVNKARAKIKDHNLDKMVNKAKTVNSTLSRWHYEST